MQALEAAALQSEGVPIVTEYFLDPSKTSLADQALQQVRPPPGVYPRGASTKAACVAIRSHVPGGPRQQKVFDALLADFGFSMEGGRWPLDHPNAAVCVNFLALQNEMLDLLEWRRRAGLDKGGPGAGPVERVTPAAAKRKTDWVGDGGAGTPRASKRTKG